MIWASPFLVVVGILVPVLAWSSYRHLARGTAAPESLPSPQAMAAQTIIVQVVVAVLAWLALVRSGMTLSWSADLNAASALATVAAVLAGFSIARLESRWPLEPGDTLRLKLRSVGITKLWFAAMVTAAIVEEFAYRGVLPLLLDQGLAPIQAALVSALLFGLAHFGQGWRGAALSMAFGLGLQVVVLLGRGLFLAMLAHLLYDLAVAWSGHRLATREKHEAAA